MATNSAKTPALIVRMRAPSVGTEVAPVEPLLASPRDVEVPKLLEQDKLGSDETATLTISPALLNRLVKRELSCRSENLS